MSFWHRAPRAVYRVYDEDEYLAGPDAHGGEQAGPGHESQGLTSGFGHIDVGHSNDARAVPEAHAREPHDVFTARSHRHRQGRMLALTVLCVVAASAAALVAFEVSHRSAPAPPLTRRVSSRLLRSVVTSSNVPISKTSTASVSASSAFSSPSSDRRAAVAPAEHGRVARLATVPARRAGTSVLTDARPASFADVAQRYASGSPPTPEPQVDREFGFEG
jgi:hypothetical protein